MPDWAIGLLAFALMCVVLVIDGWREQRRHDKKVYAQLMKRRTPPSPSSITVVDSYVHDWEREGWSL